MRIEGVQLAEQFALLTAWQFCVTDGYMFQVHYKFEAFKHSFVKTHGLPGQTPRLSQIQT